MSNQTGNSTYAERNAVGYNRGEDWFVAYCEARSAKVQRIGFDEKNGKVPNFFALSDALRHLPDFVVNYENRETSASETRVIAVKGTNKFKAEDYDRLDWFEQQYSTPRAPLYFVFMLTANKPIWLRPAKVKELYEAAVATEAAWESDGKRYRVLPL